MTDDLKIIKLLPADWQRYKSIRLETLKAEPKAFNSTFEESSKYPNEYWANKLADVNEIHFFAEIDNKIIGTVSATLKEADEAEGTAVVHGMYLNNDYRGMGAGKMLINKLLDELKKVGGINKVKLWVKTSQEPAKKLYESVGFVFEKMAGEHTMILILALDDKK